jgi:WD40 repeat protein
VWCCATTANGTVIATGSYDGMIRLWNASSGDSIGKPLTGHENVVVFVAFSPDDKLLISVSYDSIRFWHARTGTAVGEPIFPRNEDAFASALSPDSSRIVTGGIEKLLYLWDTQTRSLVGESMEGHSSTISSLTFSPDGKYIYSASDDGTICRWNVQTLEQAGHPLIGHTSEIGHLAVSPDGSRLVLGAGDNTIRVWDLRAFEWDVVAGVADYELKGPEQVPAGVAEDGWIRMADGKLLVWVPDEHRNAVRDMSLRCISVKKSDKPIQIRWDKVCHGEDWTNIRAKS